jgi:hypothetical protein
MEEGITATDNPDEAETFLGIVPLYGSADGRTGGCFELWTARRGKSKIARRPIVVVIKAWPLRPPGISIVVHVLLDSLVGAWAMSRPRSLASMT